MTGLSGELSELEAEFPGYEFATQPAWGGISISAIRREGCARPGVYAVVTGNLDEMRRALLEDERASRQVTAGGQGSSSSKRAAKFGLDKGS